jgi:hypothetical protein
MFTLTRLLGAGLFGFVLGVTALAQESRAPVDEPVAVVPAAPMVTATATARRVRFVSPGTVVQLRLEVYNATGQKLFDTELHGGNVLDWHLQDGAGQRLQPGSYACVLTIKSLSGRLSQRMGLVTVTDKKAAVKPVGASQLTLAQQQIIGPVEENAAFTILQESKAEAMSAVTHDGTDGQMARTRGALSFRMGDFFSGKDEEQMVLTEEGNLGIGTSKPAAKLDVSGDIRATGTVEASKGIAFADGTVQTTGLSGRLDANGNLVPNATGTGTQNKLAKWTDNSGALGDAVVTEVNGNIGISNPNPTAKLVVDASSGAQLRFDQGAQGITPVLSVISNPSSTTTGAAAILGAGTEGSSFVFSDNKPFYLLKDTKANVINNQLGFGTVLFTLLPTGNVGIGNTNPLAKLDVMGNINTSTQYNIRGLRVLSINGFDYSYEYPFLNNSNTLAGVDTGVNVTYGLLNSFFGKGAGFTDTGGGSNSFFGSRSGYANSDGRANSFFGTSAGAYNTTGLANTFIGENSGLSNTIENNNIMIGTSANGAVGITNAIAIGTSAKVTQSNSLVLGSIININGANADTSVGIGVTAPSYKLHILDASNAGLRVETSQAGGRVASFAANGDFQIDAVNSPGGRFAVMEGGNVGINTATPGAKLQVAGGDVAITTQSKGLILKATDGPNCVRLTVNNAGQLGTTFVACP